MTITRLGATQKYADNWEEIFGRKKRASSTKLGTSRGGSAGGKVAVRRKSAKKKMAAKKLVRSRARKKSAK